MTVSEVGTYRRLRLLNFVVVLGFGLFTLALTETRDPAVVVMISIAGLVSSARWARVGAGSQIAFDLFAAVGLAWFGRPVLGLILAFIALGVGSLALVGMSFGRAFAAGWVAIFLITNTAMSNLDIKPAGFGPERIGVGRVVTAAVAATALLLAGLAIRRVRDLVLESARVSANLDRRLTNLFGASSVPMAMVDVDGKILRANGSFEALLGREDGDTIGAYDSDLTHPGDFAIHPGLIAESDGTMRVEKRYLHSSGRQVYTEVTAIADGPASKPNMWLIQVNDLSDLRRARAEAVVTRMELDNLFERIPAALYRSLPSGKVIAGNEQLAKLLGYASMEELIASVDAARSGYRHPKDRERWQEMIDAKGTVIGFEQEMIRGDGSTMIVSDSATAIRDAHGNVEFYEGVLVDVTAMRQAQASQRRLGQVLSATSDIVAITDVAGTVLYANDALVAFGALGDPVGANIINVVPEGARNALAALVAEAAFAGTAAGEMEIELPTGDRVLSIVVQKHYADEGGQLYFSGVGRDVTVERTTARRLEALIKSKDEFIASVSHELRTPLTAAVGISLELRDRFAHLAEGERDELIAVMAEQTQEVANLVEDLLVAARMDTDSVTFLRESVDLRSAVASALQTVSYGREQEVVVEGDSKAIGDARRVRQILRNLFTNAARYGGSEVKVTITAEAGTVDVHVADNGPGIDPAQRERIFDAYQSAANTVTQPSSVGLGLTVSRWLARGMGGDLTYDFNGASVFTLSLPLQVEP